MTKQHPYSPKCKCQRCKAVKKLVGKVPTIEIGRGGVTIRHEKYK